MKHEFQARKVELVAFRFGQREKPHEMGRDHDRCLDLVSLDRGERGAGILAAYAALLEPEIGGTVISRRSS